MYLSFVALEQLEHFMTHRVAHSFARFMQGVYWGYMKINIDTADYFNARTVVWGLLGIAALMIVYHTGVIHGECRAQHKMQRQLHEGLKFFDMRLQHGATGQMPMRDVMFMHGEAAMEPGMRIMGPESGSIRINGAMPAVAEHGMRIMKMERGDEGQALFLYRNQ
jgi:hypothetical protein